MPGFNPEPGNSYHPMACVSAKKPKTLRLEPTILAVPRSTDPANAGDSYSVFTPAYVTVHLDRKGWFLARYSMPVKRLAFRGFAMEYHKGDLPDDVCAQLKNALKLPRI